MKLTNKFTRVVAIIAGPAIAIALMGAVAAAPAQAATTITSVADQTVFVGDTVTVEVVSERTKQGSGDLFNTTNDWQSTSIAGVCYNQPNLFLGTGTATTTYSFTATTTPGTYTIDVEVFRFDGCDDNFFLPGSPSEDETSFVLKVKEHPTPSSSSNEEDTSSGGGSFLTPCYYLTRSLGVAMCPTPDWAWEMWKTEEGRNWFRSLPY